MEQKLIYKKMVDVMKDVGAIEKAQTNTFQNYKFRGIDQFLNALNPALTKHGVFYVPYIESETHEIVKTEKNIQKHVHIKMRFSFFAEDGSTVDAITCGEGIDTSDKATNKAMSAALKYALMQTFAVPTEDLAEADKESPQIQENLKHDSPSTNQAPAKQIGQKPIQPTVQRSEPAPQPQYQTPSAQSFFDDQGRPILEDKKPFKPSEKQVAWLFKSLNMAGWNEEDLHECIKDLFGHSSVKDMNSLEVVFMAKWLGTKPEKPAKAAEFDSFMGDDNKL